MTDKIAEQKILEYFGGRNCIDSSYEAYHPMRTLLSSNGNRSAFHNILSLRVILENNQSWLDSKKQILKSKDAVESSSAFGEVRTYGNLLSAGFQVKPGYSTKGADFRIIDKDDNDIHIEVQTKNLAKNSSINHEPTVKRYNNREIKTAIQEIAPYGLPESDKENDSVCTNMISKICAIKQDETQLSDTEPSIVWVDLQDPTHIFSELDHCLPLLSQNEYLTSGCIWHALYGWQGACVYENSAEYDPNVFKMEHDGRFRQSSKVSGFIFSFEDATVLMENPWSKNNIPLSFKKNILSLWDFSFEYSFIDYGNKALECYIDAQKKYLQAIFDVYAKTEDLT